MFKKIGAVLAVLGGLLLGLFAILRGGKGLSGSGETLEHARSGLAESEKRLDGISTGVEKATAGVASAQDAIDDGLRTLEEIRKSNGG